MPAPAKPHPEMSSYEAEAWAGLIESVGKLEKRRQFKAGQKAKELGSQVAGRVQQLLDEHEQLRTITDAIGQPLAGLQETLSRGVTSTVSDRRILKRAGRRDADILTLEDLRAADLEVPDRMLSRHAFTYAAGLGVEGAATALAVTGGVISSTVTGGATLPMVVGAMAVDVTVNLAAAARVVAKIAMTYGYDTRLPQEQVFAMGVLGYASSRTAAGKTASLGELSRLTQTMMRGATHAQLDQFALVRATRAFFKLLGFRLSHQRLAQLIPVAGIVMNAGMNARSINQISDRAQDAYRLRFLTEKFDLDPQEWLSRAQPAAPDEANDAIDLETVIDEAIEEEGQHEHQQLDSKLDT